MANIETKLEVDLLDVDKLVKSNDLKEISNPVFFNRNNIPNSDGLLSNDIFGITKTERAGRFAYIDLSQYFINPLVYKIWCKLDSKVRDCVHGTKKFKINSKGELVEDENGSNGIEFLRKNFKDIKPKDTESMKRTRNVKFLEKYKKEPEKVFIRKFPVIPAYYRDVNTSGGYVGVGEINQLYSKLLISLKSLKESSDYGLTLSAATRGRVQEYMLDIYNWFTKGPSDSTGSGLSSKMGIIHRDILSKTSTRGSRLIISAPKLNVENIDDIMVDMDHSAIPLSAICANFFPYVVFHIRKFFDNEFGGDIDYQYVENGQSKSVKIKDYQVFYSDERIKKEINRFIHGYSNRFIPVEIPVYDKNRKMYMRFKGRVGKPEDLSKGNVDIPVPILDRYLTWCDIIYIAAVEATKDKMILITRYPIDSYFNQFGTKIVVNSTNKTEPMIVADKFYKNYPYIRQELIGTDTSNMFVDTANICNAYLSAITGDYDGDQTNNKGVFTIEANEELNKQLNSPANYISFGARNIRNTTNEGIQSLYNLTLVLPDSKLTNPY